MFHCPTLKHCPVVTAILDFDTKKTQHLVDHHPGNISAKVAFKWISGIQPCKGTSLPRFEPTLYRVAMSIGTSLLSLNSDLAWKHPGLLFKDLYKSTQFA